MSALTSGSSQMKAYLRTVGTAMIGGGQKPDSRAHYIFNMGALSNHGQRDNWEGAEEKDEQ